MFSKRGESFYLNASSHWEGTCLNNHLNTDLDEVKNNIGIRHMKIK